MYSSHEAVESFYYYNSNAMMISNQMNNDSVDADEMTRWQCNVSMLPLYADSKRCLRLPVDWNKDEESNNKQECAAEGPQPMISLDIFYALLEKYQLLLTQIPQTTSSSSKPTTLAVEVAGENDVIERKFIRGHAIDDEKVSNDGLIINNKKKTAEDDEEDSRQH
jgi:hypothetical protein